MPLATAEKIIDFLLTNKLNYEKIEIGFFGGEPLLEFELMKTITAKIHDHRLFDPERVRVAITTNGTILSEEIVNFLINEEVVLCLSCDGPKHIQDLSRRFANGSSSSEVVEKNIKKIARIFPLVPVNAVFSPNSIKFLPEIIDYFVSLGVNNIYLSPNITANWTKNEADNLPQIYKAVGEKYVELYNKGTPKHISLIDGKIAIILNGGYQPYERCRMGTGELAFTASGNVYPCERLIGSDDGKTNCIGNINKNFSKSIGCCSNPNNAINEECKACGLNNYCMNWCGCTNYYSTGQSDKVSPFMCASEKTLIKTAFNVIKKMKNNWQSLSRHLTGTPLANIRVNDPIEY